MDRDEVARLAEAAFIFAYPMLENYKTMDRTVGVRARENSRRRFNRLLNDRRLLGPEFRNIVAPNNDTLYSSAWLDLAREPVVLTVPPMADERYHVFQLVSMYNFNFGYIGGRTHGFSGGSYLIAGPGWSGKAPRGIAETFRSETRFAFLLGRTLVDGPDDLNDVRDIQDRYVLEPLGVFVGERELYETESPEFPPYSADKAAAPEFIDYLNFILANASINPDDRETLARLGPLGIAPELDATRPVMDDTMRSAIQQGIDAAREKIAQQGRELGVRVNNWNSLADSHGPRSVLGKRPLVNAAGALIGLYGNDKEEASNFSCFLDADGENLDGSRHAYVLHFPADQLPPAIAFWSITMYDTPSMLMVENPIKRYSIGDRTKDLHYAEDGSLTLYLSHESPGTEREGNWLPSPAAEFALALRIYWPDPKRFAGYAPPAVRKR